MSEATIFIAALEKPTAAERAAFLATACDGDERLLRRVEALLRAHAEPDDILDPRGDQPEAAGEGVPSSLLNCEPVGAVVAGRYKLLEAIGEGGMGTVWMAEQREPVKRLVALKLIKPGMDSRAVLARFEAERQALALMDHPSIARILDGGTTCEEPGGLGPGRPYFVMELVKGQPLTEYCDARRLSIKDRLDLFVQICAAVQHAHQKGIIHRDLKPSNVLVTEYDGQPVPKVIDFGLAKALSAVAALTDRTLYTAFGTVVGTPLYMAPEQVGINALDVDTRSDVYALGVILYELLTGTTPLEKQRLKQVAWEEVRRVIREEEPPRPSLRLSWSDTLPSLAASRQTEPVKLARLVRGDLDWIVMKALEKDRRRRYQTVNGFARDLQRYLADEPVEACPPSAGYRLHKFARKNRRILATAGAFVLLLAAAALASTWQAIRARLAETRARQAQQVAQRERQQAVTNLYHARVAEAAALRRARGMGYRRQVFNLLQQAIQFDTPDTDIDRLRDEAVACLGDFVGLEPITWEDFPAGIQKIALTPDGRQMVIALDNGTIELREVSTGTVLAQLDESAAGLGIFPAHRWLVTAGARGTIKVWQEYGTGAAPPARTIEMRADFAGMASNGRFAVGYSQQKDGGLLTLWDVARQEVKARLRVPTREPVGPVQVSDDGQWLAVAIARESKLYALVWNTPIPDPKEIFLAETYQDTRALAITPDGNFLACQHGDDGLILLDVRAAVPRPRIRSHEVLAACFSQDGRYMVYLDGSAKLWNVSHHQEVATLAHPGRGVIRSASFSTDGSTFATAYGASHSIRIWNLAGSGEKLVLSGHDGGVPCVAFSPDGKVLASGSKDRLVKLWDAATGRLLRTLPRFESSIQRIAFSPDGRLLATGQFGPTARPVQISDLATLHTFTAPDDELAGCAYGVAFSPDGKTLAACGDGLTLWRVAEAREGAVDALRLSFKRTAHLPGRRSLSLCISPDGKLLAWVDHNTSVCLWNLESAREIPFPGAPPSVGWNNFAFYPDSDHLMFTTARGPVETWDIRTMRWVSSHGTEGGGLAASLDGRWLAGPDEALWSSQTGSRVFSIPQERGMIWSGALSPDGERLAIGMADGGMAIWNVARMQAQLADIGLEWRASARPREQTELQPFAPATPLEQKLQVTQYSNLARRLAWVGRLAEAEEAYRQALKLMPHDPLTHEHLGTFLEEHGRHEEAEAEFNEAIQLQPEHGWFRVLLGGAYADQGQWDRASAEFIKAAECKEPHEAAWYSRAMLHLREGNLDGCRRMCSKVLQGSGVMETWTCTLSPESGADPDRIVSLAERLLAQSSRDHWHVNQLGAALYRAGRFEEAVTRLTEATMLSCHPYRTNMLSTWFFLAMAQHRLGHADEARHWLDQAVQGTQQTLKPPAEPPEQSVNPEGVIPPDWKQRLTLELLRREAEKLIQAPGRKSEK